MRIDVARTIAGLLATAVLLGTVAPRLMAQDTPADDMEILRDKIRADKKLLVATNLGLTESEARAFWPIYDAYQKDLGTLNGRIADLLDDYATKLVDDSLSDADAKKLINESIAIEQAEAKLPSSYAARLAKALSAHKVARYLQIENKIRAVVKYDIVSGVPLIE